MFSVRYISRAIPRASARLSAPATRRTLTSLRTPSQYQKLWNATPIRKAAFSTSFARYEAQAGTSKVVHKCRRNF
jgi:hypothetical protein